MDQKGFKLVRDKKRGTIVGCDLRRVIELEKYIFSNHIKIARVVVVRNISTAGQREHRHATRTRREFPVGKVCTSRCGEYTTVRLALVTFEGVPG